MKTFKHRSMSALVLVKAFLVLADNNFLYEKIELEIKESHHQIEAIQKVVRDTGKVRLILA